MTREELKENVETICDTLTDLDESRRELRARKFLANLCGDHHEVDHLATEIFRVDLAEKRARERLNRLELA